METAEEAHDVKEGIHDLNKKGFSTYMNLAAQRKNEGNRAFATGNRSTAVGAYQDAIEYILDAMAQSPSDESDRLAKRHLAICYANRSAARLLEGDGMDAEGALADGRLAEDADSSYAKA